MTRSQSGVESLHRWYRPLHHMACVDPAEVTQELEPKLRFVVQRRQHGDHVAWRDAHLGLVVALPDRPRQLLAKPRLEAGLEPSIHA